MPFKKIITVEPTGIDVAHWRVIDRVFNDQNKLAQVRLGGWTSKALAVAGKDPFYVRMYTSDIEVTDPNYLDYATVKGFNQAQMEDYIRTTKAYFTGATAD